MDLGVIQGQQPNGQIFSQYSTARKIVCFCCEKQGHMKKDCKVKLHDPQQQQPKQNWG